MAPRVLSEESFATTHSLKQHADDVHSDNVYKKSAPLIYNIKCSNLKVLFQATMYSIQINIFGKCMP